ncbi:MAG: hypothetical protein ACKO7W_04740 [Elainella sp.]
MVAVVVVAAEVVEVDGDMTRLGVSLVTMTGLPNLSLTGKTSLGNQSNGVRY